MDSFNAIITNIHTNINSFIVKVREDIIGACIPSALTEKKNVTNVKMRNKY